MEYESLAIKVFSETVCSGCSCKHSAEYESKPIYQTDNMGRVANHAEA